MVVANTCIVCEKGDAKYKCPTCLERYCSVACCKDHKDSPHCKPQPPKITEIRRHTAGAALRFETNDTVPADKLALLGESKELKEALANPHLQAMLTSLDQSHNPKAAMEVAMQEPIFVEFADLCLKVVEPMVEDSV